MTGEAGKKKRVVISVIIMIVAVLLLCLALFVIPRHTTPEYAVASYDDLAEKVRGLCSLPPKEAIPDGDNSYLVYLKSRFSNKVVGYLVSFTPQDGCAKRITVSCKSLSELPENSGSILPTETCGEVGIWVNKEHLCFILDECRYDIHGITASESFLKTARELAGSIIDAGLGPPEGE